MLTFRNTEVSLAVLLASLAVSIAAKSSPFWIVIDGGSTGSRLHVFEFVNNVSHSTFSTECVRRGTAKAWTPLSAFGRLPSESHDIPINSTYVAEHMLPLFSYASEIIPTQYHNSTVVKYGATAGMRLLDETEQHAVYDALYEGLMESQIFTFRRLRREDIRTLSGDKEGFYGAVAANYLKGVVDARLQLKGAGGGQSETASGMLDGDDCVGCGQDLESEHDSQHHHGPLGALDMGGSSTQIVFHTGTAGCAGTVGCEGVNLGGDTAACTKQERSADNSAGEVCTNEDPESSLPTRLDGNDFFMTSYLSYGVDQIRERLWDRWIADQSSNDATEPGPGQSCASHVIANPCAFRGLEIEWKNYTLLGTGDAKSCSAQVRRLIPHHEETLNLDKVSNGIAMEGTGGKVGGVAHPPLRGKFYAMSVYYFALDSVRVLSGHTALNVAWPTPSIAELADALDGFCARQWKGDLEEIQHDAHRFTRPEMLPHRCIEAVYMVTLLRDGFGFHSQSRDITFAFEVGGSEVEWSLGMVLSLFANDEGAAVMDSTTEKNTSHNNSQERPPMSGEGTVNVSSEGECEAQTCNDVLTCALTRGYYLNISRALRDTVVAFAWRR